eukprot:PITA_23555
MGLLRYFLGIEEEERKAAITPTMMGLKLNKEDNSKDFDPSLYKSIVGNLIDWDGSVDDRKSTSGYVFHMGSGAISWASRKQSIVALSISEAEYVAATVAVCQAIWMRRMLRSLCQEQTKGTVIFCDNGSAIALSKNYVFHKRTKHIDRKFHYIRELVNNGEMVLKHCRTQEQVADILTKPLG